MQKERKNVKDYKIETTKDGWPTLLSHLLADGSNDTGRWSWESVLGLRLGVP